MFSCWQCFQVSMIEIFHSSMFNYSVWWVLTFSLVFRIVLRKSFHFGFWIAFQFQSPTPTTPTVMTSFFPFSSFYCISLSLHSISAKMVHCWKWELKHKSLRSFHPSKKRLKFMFLLFIHSVYGCKKVVFSIFPSFSKHFQMTQMTFTINISFFKVHQHQSLKLHIYLVRFQNCIRNCFQLNC